MSGWRSPPSELTSLATGLSSLPRALAEPLPRVEARVLTELTAPPKIAFTLEASCVVTLAATAFTSESCSAAFALAFFCSSSAVCLFSNSFKRVHKWSGMRDCAGAWWFCQSFFPMMAVLARQAAHGSASSKLAALTARYSEANNTAKLHESTRNQLLASIPLRGRH
jgi:hypothetical protein